MFYKIYCAPVFVKYYIVSLELTWTESMFNLLFMHKSPFLMNDECSLIECSIFTSSSPQVLV